MDGEIRQAAVAKRVGPKAWLRLRAERGAVDMAYDLCELSRRDEVSWDAFDAFVTFVNRMPTIGDRRTGLGCRLPLEWFGSPMHTSELTPALKLAWETFRPAFEDALYDLRRR